MVAEMKRHQVVCNMLDRGCSLTTKVKLQKPIDFTGLCFKHCQELFDRKKCSATFCKLLQ